MRVRGGEVYIWCVAPRHFRRIHTGYEPALQTFAHDPPLSFIRLSRILQIVTPVQGCLCALGAQDLSGDAAAARRRHRPGHPGRETPAMPPRKATTGGGKLAGGSRCRICTPWPMRGESLQGTDRRCGSGGVPAIDAGIEERLSDCGHGLTGFQKEVLCALPADRRDAFVDEMVVTNRRRETFLAAFFTRMPPTRC